MSDEGLEKRLQEMEDYRAILELKARYCNACDGGWDRPTHNNIPRSDAPAWERISSHSYLIAPTRSMGARLIHAEHGSETNA